MPALVGIFVCLLRPGGLHFQNPRIFGSGFIIGMLNWFTALQHLNFQALFTPFLSRPAPADPRTHYDGVINYAAALLSALNSWPEFIKKCQLKNTAKHWKRGFQSIQNFSLL